MLTPLFGSPEYRNTFQRNANHNFFFSSIAFQNCVSLYDGHFVQTLTYVKHWRALNHKGNHESVKLLQTGTNNPKRGTLLLLHTLKWLLWQQGGKTDDLADDLVLNHQHLQCRYHFSPISIPHTYMKLIMHKHVQLLILIGKPFFFFF